MNLTNITHPLAIKWDTLAQKDAVVEILERNRAVPIGYSNYAGYDRIIVYPKSRDRQHVLYTDTMAENVEHYNATIHATEFITANNDKK